MNTSSTGSRIRQTLARAAVVTALLAGVAVARTGQASAQSPATSVQATVYASRAADATDDFLCNYIGDATFCGSSYVDPYYYNPCDYDPYSWDCYYYYYGW